MNELLDVCAAIAAAHGPAPVLATLVKLEGSAYSGPGARLLLLPDGKMAGALGAGCFEKDLAARAERIRGAGRSELASYDLTTDDERPWGLGMGCRGKLDLLLEPVDAGKAPDHLEFVRAAAGARQSAVVATLFRRPVADAPALGSRLMLHADGSATGALLETRIGRAVLPLARAALRTRRSRLVAPGKHGAEVLIEYVPPPIAVVVCGDGRDTTPIERLAAELGWQVTAAARGEVPGGLDDRTAALIMTHNYERDLALLAAFLRSPARYVGLLGARDRTQRLLGELAKRRPRPTQKQLARLHAPVGLDLGGETPAEVALAIVAEIQAVFAGREGGALRSRKGRIHDRP